MIEAKAADDFETGECPKSTDDFTVEICGMFLGVRDISI
jgi:hypothetical protein